MIVKTFLKPIVILQIGIFCLSSLPSFADTFYVATTGSDSADGSTAHPWNSIDYALSQLAGGSTLVIRSGVYLGGVHVDPSCNGTASKPTIIKAESKWKTKLVGSDEHGVYVADNTDWIVIDGFEVRGALADGVKLSGNHSTIKNCWVHNNAQMGCSSHHSLNNVMDSNLVEFNGQNAQLHHGIYADGDGLIIRNNIVRHNAAYGLHLYPGVRFASIYNNLVYGHPAKAGILVQCPAGGGHNVVVNNTSVNNLVALDIRGGDGEIVANNILISINGDPITLSQLSIANQIDYNLTLPRSTHDGVHGISVNPQFIDASHQCYWLKFTSPCRAMGNKLIAPKTDFWNIDKSLGNTSDIGSYYFYSALLSPLKRIKWYEGYPYRFADNLGEDIVDFWDPNTTL